MTTDKGMKIASRSLELGGQTVRLAGMCKGAGMIGPNMATMLAVVTTDAALTPAAAQAALKAAVAESFNCISVEGHMSTNDTVLLLASGCEAQAGSRTTAHWQPTWPTFQTALTDICIELATQIPDDGEGASHLIAHRRRGCKNARRRPAASPRRSPTAPS